jgi:hypothetical protein
MSWDIVLFSSGEKITSVEELDEQKLIPINFGVVLETHFKNIKKNDNHWDIQGDDFSIVYYHDTELVSNTLLNLYGEAALFRLINLSIENNWQIFDTSLGEMINLQNPEKNGFENFQSYLKQILNRNDQT